MFMIALYTQRQQNQQIIDLKSIGRSAIDNGVSVNKVIHKWVHFLRFDCLQEVINPSNGNSYPNGNVSISALNSIGNVCVKLPDHR